MSKMYRVPDNQSSRIHGPRDSTGTLYLVKRLEQAIRQRLDESLKALDLTALQYTALTVLRARPGLSSAELARASFVTAQSMNEMVLALEKKGLMKRVPSDTDRRVLRLMLTASAATVVAGADAIVDRLEAQLLGGIADETRDTFRSALYQGLKALADDAAPPESRPVAVSGTGAPVSGTGAPRRAKAPPLAATPAPRPPARSRSPRRGR